VGEVATRSLRSGYGPRLLEFRILGPLEVVDETGLIALGGPKERAVLAILLLNANRVVSIDRLADHLYGEEPPASALTQIQAHISHLRKRLDPTLAAGSPGSLIETRAPGYLVRLAREQLDLRRFERLSAEAREASSRGDHDTAASRYRDALALWRGPALADLGAPLLQPAIARLEELRVAAIEDQVDAELALGRHGSLTGELEALVSERPLHERPHGQLMLALYRSGRQAEALDVYRRLRRTLVDELGLEPGPELQKLERAILTQDPALGLQRQAGASADSARSILVVASADARIESLLPVAVALAVQGKRELILVRPVTDEHELDSATAATNARRRGLPVSARGAAFTSSDRAVDILRLTSSHEVDLVLLDAPDGLGDERLPNDLAEILEHSPAPVAILADSAEDRSSGTGVFVPFGGGEHDWAALELAAWLASSSSEALRIVGRKGEPRDASRLIADASLAVQRLVDIDTEPLLGEPTEEALVEAVANASAVVVGVSPRWRRDGVGATRRALLRSGCPLLLVHRGLRPSGLAPSEARTSFTWTLQG
jgi:DNA-binding SARP family transcriptional activator